MIPIKYRAYAYRVATAALAAAVVYGFVNGDQAEALGALIAAATTGLAAANTSTSEGA